MYSDDSDHAQQYWATCETEDLPGEMAHRIDGYYRHLEQTGRIDIWRRAARAYHGFDPEGGWANSAAVTYGGEQGEVVNVKENHFRNLIQHIIVMATGDRPAFSARALRATYSAMQQARLAERLMDYFFSEKSIEDRAREAAEMSLLYGEGWVSLTWNESAGEQYGVEEQPVFDDDGEPEIDPETGEQRVERTVVHEGDLVPEAFEPIDVVRDPAVHILEQRWLIIRRKVNRWDLVAQYPELRESILEAGSDLSEADMQRRTMFRPEGVIAGDYGDDLVELYELYHERTPAVPEGRHAKVVGDTVLLDGGLPYSEIPVYPMVPYVEMQRGYGYGHSWDLLNLQQCIDAVASVAMTNHDAFGMQNISSERDSNVSARALAEGLRLIEREPGTAAPEPLNLLQIDESTFRLLDHFRQVMELQSGVNSVARGDPEGALKGTSGTAMALVHSMALKFNSGFERSYVRAVERLGTGSLDLVKAFADTPRVAEIAGDDAVPQLVEFKSDSIRDVRRVVVELANPILRSSAGKADMAEKLADRFPQEVTMREFMQVYTTGRLEPISERKVSAAMNVRHENEALRKGEDVKALWTDDPIRHIQEHMAVLDNPIDRFDDELVNRVTAHVQEHIDLYASLTMNRPELLSILGVPPLPMPGMQPPGGAPPPGPGGPQPGGPPQGPPPGGQPPGPPPPQGGPPPGQEQQAPPRAHVPGAEEMPQEAMPRMPIDPTTGQPMTPNMPGS